MYNRLFHFFSKRLCSFDDNTRIFVLVTLLISILITSFTFFSFNIIQDNLLMRNILFCQDLGLILTSKVLDIVDIGDNKMLISFLEKIYVSTYSIKYIVLFHVDGSLSLSIPNYYIRIQDLLQFRQNLLQLETYDFLFNTPLVKYSYLFNDRITDIIVPLIKNGHNFGYLYIGINISSTFSTSINSIYKISLIMFALIWLIAIMIFCFNFITIIHPIEKLLHAANSIAYGDFNRYINLKLNGRIKDLIISFNFMAKKLRYYENQHINKLRTEKHKLEIILNYIPDGAIIIDSELRILFINKVAQKILGIYTKDSLGIPLFSCFPLYINQALLPLLNYLVRYNSFNIYKSQTEEICINLDYDTNKIFRFILTTIIDREDGILTSIAIMMQDITKESSLNQVKNQFISNVSHELRTPLCNIRSFLETLLDYRDSLSINQNIEFLKIAHNETNRLSTLVNDILDLSYVDSQVNYNLIKIDLSMILNSLLQTYQLIAAKNQIDLVVEIDPSIRHVLAHESSFYQVLSNLLSNAIKFTNYIGQIIIRAYIPLSLPLYNKLAMDKIAIVRIEVIDEGIGIEQINQKLIFDRFVRIENSIHTLQGTGLGLSIVQNILQKYNTDIFVYSLVNVGTSFYFDLLQFI
uniref:Uncharacterized sensor-like histidine kinase ycf26 n=1 Tax=Crouania attenuata TaxID=42002 RepID=A0A4D6WRL9_9FLOR|nr:Drug sensory protein A [Crouania attenuata]